MVVPGVSPDPSVIIGSCVDPIPAVRSTKVRFPDSPRVVYQSNPLVEVVCQVRFPRLLRLETELPVEFQNRVHKEYPTLKESFSSKLPDEIARAMGLDPANLHQRGFDFLTRDETWKISLASSALSLSTSRYVRWEEFGARLEVGLDAIDAVYDVRTYNRIGLRYRDVIRRSALGLADVAWSELLNPQVLGELATEDFALSAKQASRQLLLALDYPDALVRLAHGLTVDEDSSEDCYTFDADFFKESETERADAQKLLNQFHQESGRLFRWCITSKLQTAMGPTPP